MGLVNTTTNLSYARNELIQVGVSFIFDKVADMIYYMAANDDISTAGTVAEAITRTDATAPENAFYALEDIGVGYSAGSINAVKGAVTSAAVSGQTVRNMSAGWFGLTWEAAFAATGAGVTRAINAEVVTACANTYGHPNAILYLQSIPSGASSSHATMPYIVFSETATGTGSNLLFEVGHSPAATVPTIGTGELFYGNTLQIGVDETAGNRTSWYIPLSSSEASYTTAFPIVLGSTGTRTALTYDGVKSLAGFTTCASTDTGTSYEPQRFDNVLTGIGQVGGRFRINMSTDVRLGGWVNAFKAQVEANDTGGSLGLMSVGCFEMVFPKNGLGNFTCLELEATTPADTFTGAQNFQSFILCNSTGSTTGAFQDYAAFVHFEVGLVAGTGNMVGAGNSTIRVAFGTNQSTDMYIPLSTAEASYTTAYPIVSTSDTVLGVTSTFVPDSTYADYAIAIGWKGDANELDVTFANDDDQDLNLIQANINCLGTSTGPTNSSQMNVMHSLITHNTNDMLNLRLKNADFNVVIGKDVKDAYCYQGEIDFTTAAVTVAGETAVLGLVVNAAVAVTGNVRGQIISMQGTGTYTTAVGLEIRTTCGTGLGAGLSEGIRIAGTPLPVVGIAMGNQTNDNEGPQFAFFFPSTPGADIGPWSATNASGDAGKIAIKLGSSTRYINIYS